MVERNEPELCFIIRWNLETKSWAFLAKNCFGLFEADRVRKDIDENSTGVTYFPLIDAWNYNFREKPVAGFRELFWR